MGTMKTSIRKSLWNFAVAQEYALKAIDPKDDWEGCTNSWLLSCVDTEVDKLKEALMNMDRERALRKCCDAANFLFMLFDNLSRDRRKETDW